MNISYKFSLLLPVNCMCFAYESFIEQPKIIEKQKTEVKKQKLWLKKLVYYRNKKSRHFKKLNNELEMSFLKIGNRLLACRYIV
jgi:hypothetical protein